MSAVFALTMMICSSRRFVLHVLLLALFFLVTDRFRVRAFTLTRLRNSNQRSIPTMKAGAPFVRPTSASVRGAEMMAMFSLPPPTAALSNSLRDLMVPTIAIPVVLWTILSCEVRRNTGKMGMPVVFDTTRTNVKQHRREKLRLLWKILPLCIVVSAIACGNHNTMNPLAIGWEHGPRPGLVGHNFAFWASEVTMDACLDECEGITTRLTQAAALTSMLVLIASLTTSRFGHAILSLKACETLFATFLARTIDHIYWFAIAGSAILLLVTGVAAGTLASLPTGISTCGVLAYATITMGSAAVYQAVQNVSKKVKAWHVRISRVIFLGLAVQFAGTPSSWMLYDVTNFVVFLVWKAGVDSIVLGSLPPKQNKPA